MFTMVVLVSTSLYGRPALMTSVPGFVSEEMCQKAREDFGVAFEEFLKQRGLLPTSHALVVCLQTDRLH